MGCGWKCQRNKVIAYEASQGRKISPERALQVAVDVNPKKAAKTPALRIQSTGVSPETAFALGQKKRPMQAYQKALPGIKAAQEYNEQVKKINEINDKNSRQSTQTINTAFGQSGGSNKEEAKFKRKGRSRRRINPQGARAGSQNLNTLKVNNYNASPQKGVNA